MLPPGGQTEATSKGEAESAADGGEPAIAPEPPAEATDAAAIPTAAYRNSIWIDYSHSLEFQAKENSYN
jgi:hypothetical protein